MLVRGGGQKLSFLLWEALATTSGGRAGPPTQGVPSAALADGAGDLPRGRGAGTLPGAEPDPQRPMRSPPGAGRKRKGASSCALFIKGFLRLQARRDCQAGFPATPRQVWCTAWLGHKRADAHLC